MNIAHPGCLKLLTRVVPPPKQQEPQTRPGRWPRDVRRRRASRAVQEGRHVAQRPRPEGRGDLLRQRRPERWRDLSFVLVSVCASRERRRDRGDCRAGQAAGIVWEGRAEETSKITHELLHDEQQVTMTIQ